jgi:hypothetical protein
MKSFMLPAVLMLLVVSVASAQTVSVSVTQIEASGSEQKVTVDPKLSDLASILPKQFRYSNYRQISSTSSSVSSGQPGTWTLDNGQTLDISLAGVEGKGASQVYVLNVEIYTGSGANRTTVTKTTFKREKGKTSLLGIEGKAQDKALILAIKVE